MVCSKEHSPPVSSTACVPVFAFEFIKVVVPPSPQAHQPEKLELSKSPLVINDNL